MKQIFVHIGLPKTGTTAIQHFLHTNKTNLKREGFLFPGDEPTHHCISLMIEPVKGWETGVPDEENVRKSLKLFAEIKKSSLNHVIISSECMSEGKISRAKKLEEIFRQQLGDQWTAKIIIYLRRQDYWLESRYAEMVRSAPPPLNTLSFAEFYRIYRKYEEIDYQNLLKPWTETFGRDNIIVRVYEKSQIPGGIIPDFLNVLGINPKLDFDMSNAKIVNIGLSPEALEVFRLCNKNIGVDASFRSFLRSRLKQISPKSADSKYSYLSPGDRYELLREYESSNAEVARDYLMRAKGDLFREKWPDPDSVGETFRQLEFEDFVPIMMKLIAFSYGSHDSRMKNLENPLLRVLKIFRSRLKI